MSRTIEMTEWFQGTGQPTLHDTKQYNETEIGGELCDWLLAHGKAVNVTPEPTPAPETEPEIVPEIAPEPKATKAAKALADKNRIDLLFVPGSGAGGKVTMVDVQHHIAEAQDETS